MVKKGKPVSLATILGFKKLCRKKSAFLRHCHMTFEFALLPLAESKKHRLNQFFFGLKRVCKCFESKLVTIQEWKEDSRAQPDTKREDACRSIKSHKAKEH